MKKFVYFLIALLCILSYSANAQYDIKRIIPPPRDPKKDSISATFEHLALNGELLKSKADKVVIAKGDTVRIKTVFMRDYVVKIEAENGACTTPEDLKKEVWMVTFKPEKTKWFSIRVYTCSGNIHEIGKLITVVDPDKYEEVVSRMKKMKWSEKERYLDSISGGSFNDFQPRLENTRWK